MKRLIAVVIFSVATINFGFAQIDKKQLALTVSKSDAANMEKLQEFIWKSKSDVSVDGQVKLTTITEFSFDTNGKLQTNLVDAKSSVKQKPRVRDKMQESAAEDKMDYVQKTLELSLAYMFMTKG
jgi:glyceraldehyde-3-phosphate dehydrogenase/erythrose-4-phosphate dehydrogenase